MRRLILATSRSGTKYTSLVFASFGLDVGHEQIGADGAIGWPYVADLPYDDQTGDRKAYNWEVVAHQTRHPLPTIASMQTHTAKMLTFLADQLDTPVGTDRLRFLMRYWHDWTRLAMVRSPWSYQVEQLTDPEFWNYWCRRMWIPGEPKPPTVDLRTNHRPHDELTWSDLEEVDADLTTRIIGLAGRLGYDV